MEHARLHHLHLDASGTRLLGREDNLVVMGTLGLVAFLLGLVVVLLGFLSVVMVVIVVEMVVRMGSASGHASHEDG